jgi:hypothetical protein
MRVWSETLTFVYSFAVNESLALRDGGRGVKLAIQDWFKGRTVT